MDARLVSTGNAIVSGSGARKRSRGRFWTAAAFLGFTLGLLCFTLAAIVSILTLAGIIDASATIAYVIVTALMAAFTCAFLGAHALDKLAEVARENRSADDEVLYEIFTPDARS
jgi:hypothetical protein